MDPQDKKSTYGKILYVIKRFRTSDNFWVELLNDLVFVAAVMLVIMLGSYITLGVFGVPAVSVVSGSMEPNMKIADLIIFQSPDRTRIVTYQEGFNSDFFSFNDFGNVIIYGRYGNKKDRIIHRAMYRVDEGDPMWPGGPPAPHPGYITKGDHNSMIDQKSPSISYHEPVREEWVIGVSKWRIPLVGYPIKILRS